MNFFDKLKSRLNIETNKQLTIVLVIFSLSGLSISFLKPIIFGYLGINSDNLLVYIVGWILIVIPIYHVFLLVFGFLFGEFNYFWNFAIQKKIDRFKKKKVI